MGRIYKQVYSNEWMPIPRTWTIGCCDCGLVHDFKFRIRGGKLQAQVNRDNRATGQKRRHKGIKIISTKKK